MKVSILLAVHNGERFLEKSIESVLNQTYKNWELLIGFNGTIDESRKIVKKFNDERIKIFDYGDDKGKAKTLNKLIKEVSGEWIAIQDDDDIWMPKKLEEQIKYTDSFDVIGTFINYIDEDENIIGSPNLSKTHEEIFNRSIKGDNQIANTSAIFKIEHAKEVGFWSEDLDGIEDFDFWLKLIRKGYIFTNITKCYVWHRLHSKSNFNTKKHDLNKIL